MPDAPNVLFVTADQWRGDCLGAASHPVVETPHLDRLAARGTRFARHYANSAPCGPSRASLYTGLYLMNHRSATNGTPLDDRFTNVAREARALGYDPQLFGYTDTSIDPRTVADDDPRLRTYEGVLPGFSPRVHLPEGDLAPWLAWLERAGLRLPDDPRTLDEARPGFPGADDRGPTWAPPWFDADHTQTAFLTGEVLAHLDEVEGPWFVHLSWLRPHPPFRVPEPYHDRYDPADVPAPTGAPRDELQGQHPLLDAMLAHPFLAPPESERDLRQLRATYFGMLAEVDAQLGRLLTGLEARGMADDTIVVFTSDHGEMLGDHGLMHKLGWWDESYHVPLIVADPRPSADGGRGTVVERFTEHVDVVPTLLELLGADVPPQCDGRSLVAFLAGGDPADWRRAVHWEFDFRDPQTPMVEAAFGVTMEECSLAVLRDDHGRYVHFGGFPALFHDLDADPGGCHDRAGDPALAPRVLDYAQRMLSWRLRHADRTLAGTQLTPRGPVERVAPRR